MLVYKHAAISVSIDSAEICHIAAEFYFSWFGDCYLKEFRVSFFIRFHSFSSAFMNLLWVQTLLKNRSTQSETLSKAAFQQLPEPTSSLSEPHRAPLQKVRRMA